MNAFNTLILQRIKTTVERSGLQQKIFWGDEYDLISGLSGAAIYLLRYLKEVEYPQGLDQAIDFFVRLGDVEDDGPWGFWPRDRYRWDLGIAHGLPGPLSVLAKALDADLTHSRLKEVASGLSLWIIARAKEDAWGLNWPYFIEPDMDTTAEPDMALAAWCYGSPGIARALWLAGQALQEQRIKDVAVQAMMAVCQRPQELWRMEYPFFCHGIAGMLEILLRFYHDTRVDIFADTAMFLTSRLMDEFDPNLPYGFRSHHGVTGVDFNTVNLITGSTGVLLTLLACCTSVKPEWDELFGIS